MAGTTAFVAADKTVTLSIDGHQRKVTTFAHTVGDVLDSEGIQVDQHDLVSPMPNQSFRNGETIVVRYGRPLVLTIDGQTRSVWTTARNVDEALMALGVRAKGAYVSASRSRPIKRSGMALDVRMPHQLTFLADGERHEVTTTAITIRSALAEADLTLNSRDLITPSLQTRPADDQVIAITRVHGKRVVQESAIRFKTIQRESKDMFKGTTKVLKRRQGRHPRQDLPADLPRQAARIPQEDRPGHREAARDPDRGRRHQAGATEQPGRRRPQLGSAGQLRVRRKPEGLQPGRALLRALPVQREHVARRGWCRTAHRRHLRRADLPRAAALQAQWCRPVAGLRQEPVHVTG